MTGNQSHVARDGDNKMDFKIAKENLCFGEFFFSFSCIPVGIALWSTWSILLSNEIEVEIDTE